VRTRWNRAQWTCCGRRRRSILFPEPAIQRGFSEAPPPKGFTHGFGLTAKTAGSSARTGSPQKYGRDGAQEPAHA
jgi:hypothetical protein